MREGALARRVATRARRGASRACLLLPGHCSRAKPLQRTQLTEAVSIQRTHSADRPRRRLLPSGRLDLQSIRREWSVQLSV